MFSKKSRDMKSQSIHSVKLNEVLKAGYKINPSSIEQTSDGQVYLKCYLYNNRQHSHYGSIWVSRKELFSSNVMISSAN